jgi:hypothetical protein
VLGAAPVVGAAVVGAFVGVLIFCFFAYFLFFLVFFFYDNPQTFILHFVKLTALNCKFAAINFNAVWLIFVQ